MQSLKVVRSLKAVGAAILTRSLGPMVMANMPRQQLHPTFPPRTKPPSPSVPLQNLPTARLDPNPSRPPSPTRPRAPRTTRRSPNPKQSPRRRTLAPALARPRRNPVRLTRTIRTSLTRAALKTTSPWPKRQKPLPKRPMTLQSPSRAQASSGSLAIVRTTSRWQRRQRRGARSRWRRMSSLISSPRRRPRREYWILLLIARS
jgi:hypothetical protein